MLSERDSLTSKMWAKLRQLREKIFGFCAIFHTQPADRFLADYSSDAFLSCLEHSGIIASASDVRLRPEAELARVFEQYFDETKPRKFFHSTVEIVEIAEDYHKNYPGWYRRTHSQVLSEHNLDYCSYAISAGPLVRGYNWSGQANTPGRDIQFRKKPHRFSFLPRMAIAATRDPEVFPWIQAVLVDWMEYAGSVHGELAFDSNLAVIQRLMSSCWAWLILRSMSGLEEADSIRFLLLKIIRVDIKFLAPRLGTSYANNHLLADYFCGWLIKRLFPEFASDCLDPDVDFEGRWIGELLRQTYNDGGSFEQSSHYHEFACDLALSYVLISRANDWPIPLELNSRLEAMLYFQSALGGDHGVPVEIGDCIQDNFFSLGIHSGLGPALYREVYRAIFHGQICASKNDVPAVETAFWLLGGLAPDVQLDAQVKSAEFLSCGVVALHDPDSAMDLVFRTGPRPGSAVMAGHAHSDLLNITLAVAGHPMVVPSGTFTYRSQPSAWPNAEPAWRHYFRGPESGNGVVSAGEDPLGKVVVGDFRNKETQARVATSVKSSLPCAYWVEGEMVAVSGFKNYKRGLVHLQGIYTVVYDLHPLDGELSHDSIQFAPEVDIVQQGKSIVARGPENHCVYVHFDESYSSSELYCGSLSPLAGWVSPVYGRRLKAPHIHRAYRADSAVSCKLISVDPLEGIEPDITFDGSDIFLKCEALGFSDKLMLDNSGNSELRTTGGIQTDATLLWMRYCEFAPKEMRAVNVSAISIAKTLQISCKNREEWVIVYFSSGNVEVITASGIVPEIS